MKYADSITKKFQQAETQSSKTLNAVGEGNMADYQDPTYMGFMIRIDTSANYQGDLDDLPHGLFTDSPTLNPYSTYRYLLSRGEILRAAQILEFETKFRQLVEECPWYFIKVSGLGDSWKVEPAKSNWRGKDKKLVIETLESIDMKVTYLLDLYRKAVFDFNWMRYAVPDHMRWFKMSVIVTEVRPMKMSTFSYQSLNEAGHYSGSPGHFNLSEFSNFSQNFADLDNKAIDYRGLMDTSSPWTTGTFIKFSYSHCEIDAFSEAPPFLDSVGITPETLATNKITIKTGVIKEKNVYGLLGAIIEDTLDIPDYQRTNLFYPSASAGSIPIPKGAFQIGLPGANDAIFLIGELTRNIAQDKLNNTDDGLSLELRDENGRLPNGPEIVKNEFTSTEKPQGGDDAAQLVSARRETTAYTDGVLGTTGPLGSAKTLPPPPNQPELFNNPSGNPNSAASVANNYVNNLIRTQVNRALLGNVYGISPLTLLDRAQSIINDPVGAVTNLLRKFSSPKIGSQLGAKVQLTAPEMQLIRDIIGTAESIQAKGEPLPSAASNTDQRKGPIGKTNMQAFAAAGSNPGKVTFESTPVPPTSLGKSNFS